MNQLVQNIIDVTELVWDLLGEESEVFAFWYVIECNKDLTSTQLREAASILSGKENKIH